MSASTSPLLEVDHLSVEFRSSERVVAAVRDVSFYVGRGETVAIDGLRDALDPKIDRN
ncbi:MAG TPA: hypothetical protein VIM74_02480 [Casimicrobiaceae bacterium]|jgi:glutathione transport system ATP-binding protein